MAYDYSNLVKQTQHWAEQAQITGWINDDIAKQIHQHDTHTSEILFSTDDLDG